MTGHEQSQIVAVAEREGCSAVLAALAQWCTIAAEDCRACNDSDSAREYLADAAFLRKHSDRMKARNN